MEKPQLIVFDLGGVLIDWNPRYLYRRLIPDEAAMERFLTKVCTPDWNAQQDGTRTFADGTALLVAQYPEHRTLIEAYFTGWPEMVSGAVEGTVNILREVIAARHRVCALSNWSAETYPHAEKRFDFLHWFEFVAVSGRLGFMKPDREIFDYVTEKSGVAAQQCLFIDDSLSNVRAAQALGWQAIHFTSPEALRAELIALGLLRTSA
ncbi:MAG: HAD family phosphatase [Acidobacteria bacterium]|nr:HAD family phosphatase [Acidobacteriota bacterium]